jgi:hypothetical protein
MRPGAPPRGLHGGGLFADADGRHQAMLIEGLYLANLLAAPGLAFLGLLWFWSRRAELHALARCHLRQALSGSLWALGMLIGFNGLILWWIGIEVPAAWLFVLLYFLTIHSSLVLFGMYGLSQAMAGKTFRYPVVGLDCVEELPHGRR